MMKTGNLEIKFERRFVLENLPEPLTRASEHLQFFDNYLTDTRLWLRRIRYPATREWKHFFVQKYSVNSNLAQTATAEIELSQYEYEVLSIFEGNELRYNRYFFEFENAQILLDVLLNRELWNLIIATIEFGGEAEMAQFVAPLFLGREITHNENLTTARLTDLTLADVQKHLS